MSRVTSLNQGRRRLAEESDFLEFSDKKGPKFAGTEPALATPQTTTPTHSPIGGSTSSRGSSVALAVAIIATARQTAGTQEKRIAYLPDHYNFLVTTLNSLGLAYLDNR